MATPVTDMVASMTREVNPPGFELFPSITPGEIVGYIEDGFWEGRLTGLFEGYTVVDGGNLTPPGSAGLSYITDGLEADGGDEADLPADMQMLVVLLGGFRLLQRRAFTLAQNLRAHAGPVEYEVQISATVLRELVQSLERRLQQMKDLHSDEVPASAFYYMDGVAQSTYSMVSGLADLTIVY